MYLCTEFILLESTCLTMAWPVSQPIHIKVPKKVILRTYFSTLPTTVSIKIAANTFRTKPKMAGQEEAAVLTLGLDIKEVLNKYIDTLKNMEPR